VIGHIRAIYFLDYANVSHSVWVQIAYGATGLGHAAVIVFFVLSGFWVGGGVLDKVRRNQFNVVEYVMKRLIRLWIVLVPALVLTAVLDLSGRLLFSSSAAYLGAHPSNVLPIDLYETLTLKVALGNAVFLQHLLVPPFGTNTPLWSLAYEFWYYAMFPCAVIALGSSATLRSRTTYAIAFLLACCISGTEVMALFPVWLLGAAVAYKQVAIRRLLSCLPRSTLCIARLVASITLGLVVLGVSAVSMHERIADGAVGIATACLLALLITDLRWRGICKRLLRIGSGYARASYSLYAIHLPIIVISSAVFMGRSEDRWQPDVGHIFAGTVIMFSVVLIAQVFARFTEFNTERVRAALIRLQPWGVPSDA
jgi:peptidoglycan/LPS O-acetylase OafA/YrhL